MVHRCRPNGRHKNYEFIIIVVIDTNIYTITCIVRFLSTVQYVEREILRMRRAIFCVQFTVS